MEMQHNYFTFAPAAIHFSEQPEPPDFKLMCIGDSNVGKTTLITSYVTQDFREEFIPPVVDNFVATVPLLCGKEYKLQLWDTHGAPDYYRIRPVVYPNTHVFLVCFSLVNKDSLANVKTQWVPELKQHCPEAKFILVGLKNDLVPEKMRTGKNWRKKEYAKMHRKIVKFWIRNCSKKIGKFDVSNITHKNYPNDLIKMIANFSEIDDTELQNRVSQVRDYYLYRKKLTKLEHITQSAIHDMIKDVKCDGYVSCSAKTGDGLNKVFETAIKVCLLKTKRKKCNIL